MTLFFESHLSAYAPGVPPSPKGEGGGGDAWDAYMHRVPGRIGTHRDAWTHRRPWHTKTNYRKGFLTMSEEVVTDTGEHWLDHRREGLGLQAQVATLRRLVGSMALAIPREHLPPDEREALDAVLGAP